MLLAQGLTRLLHLWDSGELDGAVEDLIRGRVPVILAQILTRTLKGLEASLSSEVTAYAVLTLACLSSLPWFNSLEPHISVAVDTSRKRIAAAMNSPPSPQYLWIEKVTYNSPVLCQTYCLAALKVVPSLSVWGNRVQDLVNISTKSLVKFAQFFSRLPTTSKMPESILQASLIEGYMFYPQLKKIRLDVYPRKSMAEDKYLEYNPLSWTVSNNNQRDPLSANFLWEMMVISMLNTQTDEFIESVIGDNFANNLTPIKQLIHRLCLQPDRHPSHEEEPSSPQTNGDHTNGAEPNGHHINSHTESKPALEVLSEVSKTLSSFTNHIMRHPFVQRASLHDQRTVAHELRIYLLAHITQIEDNARLTSEVEPAESARTRTIQPCAVQTKSYYNWVHTTSADHTSCPYSWAFMACLLGSGNSSRGITGCHDSTSKTPVAADCFIGVRQKYIAESLCRHLATLCRQYNDYGSIARDRAEGNLNSVDFPEFHEESDNIGGGSLREDGDGGEGWRELRGKEALFEIAEFERRYMEMAKEKLMALVPERVAAHVGLFVDVTDLYGQIYVARDIASRVR